MAPLDEYRTGLLFRNLIVLDFVALPVAVLGLILNERLISGSTGVSSAYDLLLPYLVGLLPVSMGGALHQLLAMRLPNAWSARRRRVVFFVTSPLVLCVLFLMLEPAYMLRLTLPIVTGLILYSILSRLPKDADRTTVSETERAKPGLA